MLPGSIVVATQQGLPPAPPPVGTPLPGLVQVRARTVLSAEESSDGTFGGTVYYPFNWDSFTLSNVPWGVTVSSITKVRGESDDDLWQEYDVKPAARALDDADAVVAQAQTVLDDAQSTQSAAASAIGDQQAAFLAAEAVVVTAQLAADTASQARLDAATTVLTLIRRQAAAGSVTAARAAYDTAAQAEGDAYTQLTQARSAANVAGTGLGVAQLALSNATAAVTQAGTALVGTKSDAKLAQVRLAALSAAGEGDAYDDVRRDDEPTNVAENVFRPAYDSDGAGGLVLAGYTNSFQTAIDYRVVVDLPRPALATDGSYRITWLERTTLRSVNNEDYEETVLSVTDVAKSEDVAPSPGDTQLFSQAYHIDPPADNGSVAVVGPVHAAPYGATIQSSGATATKRGFAAFVCDGASAQPPLYLTQAASTASGAPTGTHFSGQATLTLDVNGDGGFTVTNTLSDSVDRLSGAPTVGMGDANFPDDSKLTTGLNSRTGTQVTFATGLVLTLSDEDPTSRLEGVVQAALSRSFPDDPDPDDPNPPPPPAWMGTTAAAWNLSSADGTWRSAGTFRFRFPCTGGSIPGQGSTASWVLRTYAADGTHGDAPGSVDVTAAVPPVAYGQPGYWTAWQEVDAQPGQYLVLREVRLTDPSNPGNPQAASTNTLAQEPPA